MDKTYIGVPQRVEVVAISQDSRAFARGNVSRLPSGRYRAPAWATRYNKRHYNTVRVWRAS